MLSTGCETERVCYNGMVSEKGNKMLSEEEMENMTPEELAEYAEWLAEEQADRHGL